MAGSMVATPASANISLELSGEAQVTISTSDSCGDAPATAAAQNDVTGHATLAALNTATGITFTSDSAGSMDVDTVTFTDYRCDPKQQITITQYSVSQKKSASVLQAH